MNQSPPLLSIIIVSWNVRELLDRCLASIMKYGDVPLHVVVVDNASKDGSALMVRKKYPDVLCIENTQNKGFARANNQGIRYTQGRYTLLLNPDTEIHEHTLSSVTKCFENNAHVGAVGCSIRNTDGSYQHSVRRDPTPLSQILVLCKLHAFFPNLKLLKNYYATDFSYTHDADVEQVMGAFLAFRSDLCSTIGLLDERFFLWFEEVDFCLRIRNSGYLVHYCSSASITHRGGESFGQLLTIEQQTIFNRSLLRYARKHFGFGWYLALCLFIPVSLLFALGEPILRKWYVPKPIR